MLVRIPQFLDEARLIEIRNELERGRWGDGKGTAQGSARAVKQNEQLGRDDEVAVRLSSELLAHLRGHAHFRDAALPANMSRIVFARYVPGMAYGPHLDLPHMGGAAGGQVRTDMAFTIFLDAPETYDGGELHFFSDYGEQMIKGDAGELVLYPASTVHEVRPVTRGRRHVAIAWVQSLVADPARRMLLHDLLTAARGLEAMHPTPEQAQLVRKSYYNLLRAWSQP